MEQVKAIANSDYSRNDMEVQVDLETVSGVSREPATRFWFLEFAGLNWRMAWHTGATLTDWCNTTKTGHPELQEGRCHVGDLAMRCAVMRGCATPPCSMDSVVPVECQNAIGGNEYKETRRTSEAPACHVLKAAAEGEKLKKARQT
eukprot:scaffold63548_cov18-Tisochrysis_lutea.AAC.1